MGYGLLAIGRGPFSRRAAIDMWAKYILDKALAGPVLFRSPRQGMVDAGQALLISQQPIANSQ
jgi:hypothetical protein